MIKTLITITLSAITVLAIFEVIYRITGGEPLRVAFSFNVPLSAFLCGVLYFILTLIVMIWLYAGGRL